MTLTVAILELAGLVLIWRMVSLINQMDSRTCHIYRLGCILMAAGALSLGCVALLGMADIRWHDLPLPVGLTAYLAGDQLCERIGNKLLGH